MAVELSFCVITTDQRTLLRYCLDAIARERATLPVLSEVLVLDNASGDGAAEAARRHPATDEVIAQPERRGRAENLSTLLARARGRACLLLDEDTELEPGATAALLDALADDPQAGAAGAALVCPDGGGRASAWRFPTPWTAVPAAFSARGRIGLQSGGEHVRSVDWALSAAMLVRREAAAAAGGFDPGFAGALGDADFCKRLEHAGWHVLYVPAARAAQHEPAAPARRDDAAAALAADRDRYMRRHHSAAAAGLVRWASASAYALRAGGAVLVPGHDARQAAEHASAALAAPRADPGAKEGPGGFG